MPNLVCLALLDDMDQRTLLLHSRTHS